MAVVVGVPTMCSFPSIPLGPLSPALCFLCYLGSLRFCLCQSPRLLELFGGDARGENGDGFGLCIGLRKAFYDERILGVAGDGVGHLFPLFAGDVDREDGRGLWWSWYSLRQRWSFVGLNAGDDAASSVQDASWSPNYRHFHVDLSSFCS